MIFIVFIISYQRGIFEGVGGFEKGQTAKSGKGSKIDANQGCIQSIHSNSMKINCNGAKHKYKDNHIKSMS